MKYSCLPEINYLYPFLWVPRFKTLCFKLFSFIGPLWTTHFVIFSYVVFCFAVQLLSRVWLFATLWTAARQPSLSFAISQSLLRFMSIESVMPSNNLILCRPFSPCPQFLPASESFPVNQVLVSGGQNIGASASVLPMNTQDWFPLGLSGLISLLSKVHVL